MSSVPLISPTANGDWRTDHPYGVAARLMVTGWHSSYPARGEIVRLISDSGDAVTVDADGALHVQPPDMLAAVLAILISTEGEPIT